MKISERDRSFSRGPAHDDVRVQCRKRHRHVGGMGSDTGIGPSEDGVIAIEAVESRTAGARPPLVAGEIILVAEVGTARALHDVAAHRRHVSELIGGGEQQRLGDDGKALAYLRVRCHVAHPGQCADAQPAVWQHLDSRHIGQAIDVQQALGKCRAVLHQAEQIGTACDESELGVQGMGRDCFHRIIGSREAQRDASLSSSPLLRRLRRRCWGSRRSDRGCRSSARESPRWTDLPL